MHSHRFGVGRLSVSQGLRWKAHQVTLGGASVSPTGYWKPALSEDVTTSRRVFEVRVRAASAAIVTLQGHSYGTKE